MRYPKMNKQPKRVVNIPLLQGGVNLRDALNMCADNQLTDSVNMWFKDGMLQTRPGIEKKYDWWGAATPDDSTIEWSECNNEQHLHSDVVKVMDGKMFTLLSFLSRFKDYSVNSGDKKRYYSRLDFFWVTDDGEFAKVNPLCLDSEIKSYFIATDSENIYIFLNSTYGGEIRKYTDEFGWMEVSDEEIHAPIVFAHCKQTGLSKDIPEEAYYAQTPTFESTLFEGLNLIGNRYKMIYSTINKENSNHYMIYRLGYELPKGKKGIVKAVITHPNGQIATHEVEWCGDETCSGCFEGKPNDCDGLEMYIRYPYFVYFYKDGKIVILNESDYVEDNLEITAPCDNDDENFKKVCSMTTAEWFGGASEGINGGARLFLSGNTEEKEKSLVIWSDLNKPLYFPENCYSYVGNSGSAVKGFGKQDDMLVIFKENEIYYTKYAQNSNITAEDLINQSVVDYAASNVYFPLVQINPVIGCLSQETIKLCRNRLVWLGQDKKVYTLTTASQYSERNVFCISEMIEKRLRAEDNLKKSYALDYDGHYMLIVGEKAYVMDYNSYGYQYVYSYQKAEDANLKIPWYIWQGVNDASSIVFNINDTLCRITYSYVLGAGLGSKSWLVTYTFTADNDDGKPIYSMAQTKFFDFNNPNFRKNIEAVGLSLGNNGGEQVKVKFITESGEDSTVVSFYSDETDSRDAGYIKSRILYPSIRSAVRFAVRFECEGNMAIEGLNITYRTLGGAR